MTAIAHFIAITCYIGAAALAATPFARPVGAPVRGVTAVLAVEIFAHAVGLFAFAIGAGQLCRSRGQSSLFFAGLTLAITLLVVWKSSRTTSAPTLAAAPLAAIITITANVMGRVEPAVRAARGSWPMWR